MQTHARHTRNRRARHTGIHMQYLEGRRLLSVTLDPLAETVSPLLTLSPSATASISGYTPAQISQAYGFNLLKGDGAGQTIAIVDAYRDPNIAADLHTFDQQFNLSDPTLTLVNQTGGSVSSVAADPGWSTEIALDVEWAHAMAPKANITLVEANSASLGDLMTAVDYARHAAGVSVVSMSWGGSEFWGQQQLDSYFTTPTGHGGVTFVAASGDSGSWYGPSWPSSSANVLAVGGSVLHLNSTGGYGSETGWSYSTGGISQVVPEPTYQFNAQHTGGRTTPDVAYNASGFAIYSSVADQGISGWSVVGGTSAGAPQWAALIAIANQLRLAAGKGALDGATGTLPMLYALYNAPGNAGYAAYAAAFNDITSGASSYFLAAHPGYDGVTGLGTPKAVQVVGALVGTTAKTGTGATLTTLNKPAALAKAAVVRQAAPVAAAVAAAANSVTVAASSAVAVFSNAAMFDHGHAEVASGAVSALVGRALIGAASSGTGFGGEMDAVPTQAMPAVLNTVNVVEDAMPQALGTVAAMAVDGSSAPVRAIEALPQLFESNTLAVMASDGIGAFARESAMFGAAMATDLSPDYSRAKQVTLFTLAVDTLLVSAWAAHVWNKRRTATLDGGIPPIEPLQPFGRDED